jgi:hypothetical protein
VFPTELATGRKRTVKLVSIITTRKLQLHKNHSLQLKSLITSPPQLLQRVSALIDKKEEKNTIKKRKNEKLNYT